MSILLPPIEPRILNYTVKRQLKVSRSNPYEERERELIFEPTEDDRRREGDRRRSKRWVMRDRRKHDRRNMAAASYRKLSPKIKSFMANSNDPQMRQIIRRKGRFVNKVV